MRLRGPKTAVGLPKCAGRTMRNVTAPPSPPRRGVLATEREADALAAAEQGLASSDDAGESSHRPELLCPQGELPALFALLERDDAKARTFA